MSNTPPTPILMSHEERRKLIETPIILNVISSTRSWGGITFLPNSALARHERADIAPDNTYSYFNE